MTYDRSKALHAYRETLKHKQSNREVTGRVGYGFRSEKTCGVSRIVEDPDEQALIEEARRLKSEGCSIRQTLRIMTAKGLRTKKGRRMRAMDLWRAIKVG